MILGKQEITRFLYKLTHHKKYYFIATVREEHAYRKDGSKYTYYDNRTWGFFTSKKKAIRAVKENWTDMNECGYYPWTVIGTYTEGLLSRCYEPELWFKENYKEITDEELKNLWNNCPESKKTYCTINKKTGKVNWYDPVEECICSNFTGYIPCSEPDWAHGFSGWAL